VATTNSKFVAKNGLAVGTSIDVINSDGEWVGATGSLNGATGPAGVDGATGSQGINGASGFVGSNGATGIQGASGSTGIGATGSQGIGGATGPEGVQGIQGVEGASGITGASGTNGATGSAGSDGATGAQGIQGASGSTGLTGSTGPQGSFGGAAFDYTFMGATGVGSDPGAGKITLNNSVATATVMYISQTDDFSVSIYNYLQTIDDSTSAIKGHFTITEKADTANFALFAITGFHTHQTNYFDIPISYVSGGGSLVSNDDVLITFARTGDKGDTGLTGATGIGGNNGATGIQGASGIGATGISGATGTAGNNGATGPEGVQGIQGIQGASGATGVAGTNGINGATGTFNAAFGYQMNSLNVGGASGATGATGSIFAVDLALGTSNQAMLASSGSDGAAWVNALGVGNSVTLGATGSIRAADNVTAYFSSDRTLKENIIEIPDALNKVLKIGGKMFDWTDAYIAKHGGLDSYFQPKADFGVIAQDVQAVFPVAVRTRQDGTLAVDYEKLCALAFAAIKELNNKIDNK
jgi:hypothetical protein